METAKQQRGRPFKSGQSGNPLGRPRHSKNRFSSIVLAAIAEDFARNGAEAIARVRKKNPVEYLRFINSLIPREVVAQHEAEMDDYSELTQQEFIDLMSAEQRQAFVEYALKLCYEAPVPVPKFKQNLQENQGG